MKYLIVLILLITSCDKPSYLESKYRDSLNDFEIRYFKDTRTGVCFAERGSENGNSFTCVPCDSVKNFIK